MAKKYLDSNGLLYFWQKIKSLFALKTELPTKTSDLTNDSNYVADASYTHTDNNYTTTEKNKLAGIASGAEVNVQADWDVTDSSSDAYIKNKPTIPSGVSPSSTTPKMDGTATVGTEAAFARGDHIHPSDTSRVPTSRTVNGKALSSNIIIGAGDIDSVIGESGDHIDDDLNALETGLNSKANGNARIFYGTCSTAAVTAEKAVSCPIYDGYHDGDILIVSFTHENTASTPKLNVNSKGAKDISIIAYDNRESAYAPWGDWSQGDTVVFRYEIVTVDWIALIDTDTTYSAATTSVDGLMSSTDKTKLNKLVFDSNNIIDSSILPSYVDDVIEAYPRSGATELSSSWLSTSSGGSALTPETGKIYVLMADSTSYVANTQFRWSGTTYVKLSDGGVSEITNSEIDTIVAS